MKSNLYSVIWSEQDQEYVGLCSKFPSLSFLAKKSEDALSGIKDLVADIEKEVMPSQADL